MKKITALILTLVTMMVCTAVIPAVSSADSLYIIPDSDTRELTRAELWGY